jgi:hypothetical protein
MRAVKMFMAAVTATMLMGAAVSVPVASASGGSATMDLAAMQFPSGGVISAGTSGTVPVTPGSTVDLTTPATLPDSADAQDQYQFMFWDVDGTISTTATTSFTAPTAGTTFDAYAWYRLTGPSTCTGSCPPELATWAFSAPENELLSGTPIQSATSGWTAGSQYVLTADAPSVTALSHFAPPGTPLKEQLLYPPFIKWQSFFGTGVTTSGVGGITLNVPANQSPWAIAFYGAGSNPILPCQHGSSPTCT